MASSSQELRPPRNPGRFTEINGAYLNGMMDIKATASICPLNT